ncbi:MAG: hypothetical protein AAFU85_25285 [Planctomycetota bacterium]
MLCALLGIFWAIGPTLHGVVHLTEVEHRHTAGSAHAHHHDHDDSDSHGHRPHSGESGHDHGDPPSKSPEPTDRLPEPSEPASDGSQIFFTTLELAAPASVAVDVEFSFAAQSLGDYFVERVKSFSSLSIGASGPRGPPIWT